MEASSELALTTAHMTLDEFQLQLNTLPEGDRHRVNGIIMLARNELKQRLLPLHYIEQLQSTFDQAAQ